MLIQIPKKKATNILLMAYQQEKILVALKCLQKMENHTFTILTILCVLKTIVISQLLLFTNSFLDLPLKQADPVF